jgi:hypothetical protein
MPYCRKVLDEQMTASPALSAIDTLISLLSMPERGSRWDQRFHLVGLLHPPRQDSKPAPTEACHHHRSLLRGPFRLSREIMFA